MALIYKDVKEHGTSLRCKWTPVTQGDTFESLIPGSAAPLGASVQVSGTWGGATAGLECSNDSVNWFPVKDLTGAVIALTANGLVEFSCSAVCVRPKLTGGAASSLSFHINMRG